MRTRTMRKIASWNSQLDFPKETKSFKTYRFFEGIGWVVIDKGQVKQTPLISKSGILKLENTLKSP